MDWRNAVEHKPGQRSPSEFTNVTDDFIEDLQYTPSMLFARKFTEKSNVGDFTSTVLRVD